MNIQNLKQPIINLFFVFGFIVIWELLIGFNYVNSYVFAKPTAIFHRIYAMLFYEGLLLELWQTIKLSIIGTFWGLILGCSISLVMINLRKSQSFAEFILDFARSIPLTTLIPVIITIYGIGNNSKIAIGGISAGLTTALTLYIGLKNAQERKKEFIFLYKPRFIDRFLKIYPFEAKSSVFSALKLSISISLVLVIVSEMFIGTDKGIGKLIMDKSYSDDRAGQFGVILLTGIIGWGLNKIIDFFKILV